MRPRFSEVLVTASMATGGQLSARMATPLTTTDFLDMVSERPLPGLRVTTDIVLGEDHGSGVLDAFRSFIRTCYATGVEAP